MSIDKKIYTLAFLGMALLSTSCKKYLDVNKNPNVLTNPTVSVLLPSAQIYLASAVGTDAQVNGSMWAQYWTQNPSSSQYRAIEQYQPTSSTYNFPWDEFYTAGSNLYQMDLLSKEQAKPQYRAVGLLLRAYMFQVMTDSWGDIPFSEALKGQQKDGGIVNPHYDLQRAIYTGILGYIDTATKIIKVGDPSSPGADDLIFGGDMTKWKKFANTLKLRILLRMIYADQATAQAGITALYATSPEFLGSGEDAQIAFLNTAGNKNPLYTTQVQLNNTQNLVASKTCIDQLNNENDYRIYVFYEPASSGAFVGIAQGNFSTQTTVYSIPSYNVAGDANNDKSATAPVKFLTGYESYFLQAEAAARGFGTPGEDSSLFVQGIAANFNSYASAFADADIQLAAAGDSSANGNVINSDIYLTPDYGTYSYLNGDTIYGAPPSTWAAYPVSGSLDQKLKFIITQKWFSMCGNEGLEAWAEWRRTGYPDFFVISANSIIGNQFPRRFLYPATEISSNLNFPGVKPVTTKVWWDVR